MNDRAAKVAEFLLKIQAVKLSPSQPFTWASGMKSPIYCDNRVILSYPDIRKEICKAFHELVKAEYPDANAVAGVATAGIAHGILLAEAMNVPFVYVRSSPKAHGLNNQVEGRIEPGQKYIVVEDLVSTGGSSLQAALALKAAGTEIAGLVSIFQYGFPKALELFKDNGIRYSSLSNLESLLQKAGEISYIQPVEMDLVLAWKKDPQAWSEAMISKGN